MSDYYNTLDISRNASPDDIKNAYKRLARTHHPDRGGNKDEFQKIQSAYETLSDPDKKSQYDSPHNPHQNNIHHNHMDNMFPFEFAHQFFNQHNQRKPDQMIKKSDHLYTCKITLKEVYYGSIKKLKVHRIKKCFTCTKHCDPCNGSGIVKKQIQMGPFMQLIQQTCSNCNGCGKKHEINKDCSNCNGTGNIQEDNIFEIKITPGTTDGKKFTFDGWGEQPLKNNEVAGSFIVTISIEPDTLFTRNNLDLFCNIQLTFLESIIGKMIIIPHFNEKIDIDTRGFGLINPNKNYILYKKGLVNENGTYGNLNIKFIINYPEKSFNENELVILNKAFDEIKF